MEAYDKYKYIYPPRPATVLAPSALDRFEEMGFWGQPKLNGSNSISFTDSKSLTFMNRHKQPFTNFKLNKEEIISIHKGKGWMSFCGEYMNKSQRDTNGKVFNQKLVLYDLIVFENQHLIGSTFEERQKLMDEVFPSQGDFDPFLQVISDNIFRVKNFKKELLTNFKAVTQHEMYEGEVLKRPTGKLEAGYREANNVGWQAKCRKPTKNYSY